MALSNYFPRRRHIHVEDGFGPDEADGQLMRRVLFRRFAMRRTAKFIVPSRALFELAVGTWRIAPSRVQYLPNGIDCRKFQCSPDRALLQALGLTSDVPIVGTVAALRTEKNLARLIRSFARVRKHVPAKLVIAGDGPERLALTALVEELALSASVIFVGHLPEPERLLGAFDVFALSSDTEQMPYSILEAMAAGLPIVSVDVGDVRQMVSTENLPFIVARNDEALSESLRALLANAKTRQNIGIRNRERATRHFDQQQMLESYDQLYAGPQSLIMQGNRSCAELQASPI